MPAILGGKPAFENQIFVGTPNLLNRERFLHLANEALDSRLLTNFGPLSLKFQKEICRLTGAKYSLAVCNATIGLELALLALNLKGEVILPSFTFVATAHSLRRAGLTPVFCDINPATHSLDPAQLEKLINSRTAAILPVHMWGQVCPDVEEIERLARKHGLAVLYDAAHAFGSEPPERPISSFGDAQVFSFHATKFINSFEGGAITTNSEALYTKLRLFANFGFSGLDQVTSWGTNAKMNEICAAMGIAEVEEMDSILGTNRSNYLAYRQAIKVDGVRVLDLRHGSNCQYIVLNVDEQRLGLTRDQLLQTLWAENILARRYFFPGCHRMEPYASDRTLRHGSLVQTDKVCGEVLILPTGQTMIGDRIERVARVIQTAAVPEIAGRIRGVLPPSLPIGAPLGAIYTYASLEEAVAAQSA
jgi:dTDP-4-amino-4,6-dideoxygalactose transaminase